MFRKLAFTVLFVILSISLFAAVYNEAPVLAEKVRNGDLPPVAERLPENPLVIQVYEEIGQYGGEIYGGAANPRARNSISTSPVSSHLWPSTWTRL